ncbi:MAG: type II toxin-antitoxin system VapC family toxin [Candidatus Hodarchaeales archaeon]|jgi:tRNA(fMet)-specific endonuclease VapC
MKFLDTSFLIDVIRKNTSVKELLDEIDDQGPHMTNTIVAHEFLVGAYGAKNHEKELKVRNDLLSRIIILNIDSNAATKSAEVEAELRTTGELIGGADILIVGTMLSRGIKTIVTNNIKHFKKISDIQIQTW